MITATAPSTRRNPSPIGPARSTPSPAPNPGPVSTAVVRRYRHPKREIFVENKKYARRSHQPEQTKGLAKIPDPIIATLEPTKVPPRNHLEAPRTHQFGAAKPGRNRQFF